MNSKDAKKAITTCPNMKTPTLFSPVSVYNGTVVPPGAKVVKGRVPFMLLDHIEPAGRAEFQFIGFRTPKVTTAYNDYKYAGCYEDVGPRLLSTTLAIKVKSVKSCLDAAKNKGFAYAGLEYGGECYASNVKPRQSKRIGYDKCSMLCADDRTTICGGPSASRVRTSFASDVHHSS